MSRQKAQGFIDGFKGTPGEVYAPDLFGEELELNLVAGLTEVYAEVDRLQTDYDEIQQIRDAELSSLYQLRKVLSLCQDFLKTNPSKGLRGMHLQCRVVDALEEAPERSLARVQAPLRAQVERLLTFTGEVMEHCVDNGAYEHQWDDIQDEAEQTLREVLENG